METLELLYQRSRATWQSFSLPSCPSLRGTLSPQVKQHMKFTALRLNEMDSKIKSSLTVVWHSVFVVVVVFIVLLFSWQFTGKEDMLSSVDVLSKKQSIAIF